MVAATMEKELALIASRAADAVTFLTTEWFFG